ncbi:MAG: zinc-dependent metalloprotease family protein [Saprospiraceae bacterium]|nr:zinc-dependent metalloprotease family protein [Saprospiraceae bacterium]
MRSIIMLVLISMVTLPLFGQNWTPKDAKSIPLLGERNINPQKFTAAQVNDDAVKEILWSAPNEIDFNPKTDQATVLRVMLADGSLDDFSIVRYQMMEPNLAMKYDQIRTFHGRSTTNPVRRIRINYTVHGLRAVITDESGQTYIDHFQRRDKTHKIIYRRNDFVAHEDWTCDFQDEKLASENKKEEHERSGDCLFRSYRFAMTTTGEYSNYHGAFSEDDSMLVMSAVVTTVDRVNDVFEQDLTMRLILIDNTNDIFYYDPATDPFSGSSAGSMISQNQTNTDAVIGSANYDLGHIVSTGGSGLASLGVVCANGAKARGVTGISVPEGDPFDIDYVAHEIGHQLGANHTQNNSCNRNNSTAMEPGSASTIMGYAGICSPNVQNNSDAYFHAISIQEMNAELTSNSCHGVIGLSNVAPEIPNPLINKSIPHSTPFVLDVVATDGDGDVLTYNWEQMDNEVGPVMPPAGTNAQGPMFRSKFAVPDSKRYFPNLTAVTTNTSDVWEVLPTVDRNMDFRVTVRDNTFLPGCTVEEDITIDVEGNAGPFLVTSQNTATTWLETQSATISWDVANTDLAPVSCANVDILISYDSGMTYPTTLATSVPNDGSHPIFVPVGTSTSARIMVKCSDNVFYDINDTDITINEGSPSFTINTNPSSGTVCDDQTLDFTLESMSLLGFLDPITLTVSDLPVGATASIANNPITPGNSTTITLDNMDGLVGLSFVKVTGVSGPITEETSFALTIENNSINPTLTSPANGSTGAIAEPTLSWVSTPGVPNYEYEVSTLPNGGNVVRTGITPFASVVITPELNLSTTYFWRVRSITNCGTTDWSDEWTFETGTCITKMAEDLPITISSNGTPTITSSLTIIDKGVITDLNIVDLEGVHTYVSDLNFTLSSPDGTDQTFWSDPCNFQNNFDINFDDEAASSNYPCPPTNGQAYIPDSPLSVFDMELIQGEWILTVFDDFDADGGALNSWGLEVCLDDFCDLTVDNNAYINTNGSLKSALDCAISGDTIYLETAIAGNTIDAGLITISIDEDIVIVADPNDNIRVLSEGNSPTFIIDAGTTVSFIGFNIENIDSTVGVIENNGTLSLEDMNITSGVNMKSVVNNNSSILNLKGDCNLVED